jgi:hypothetical protein
MARSSLWFASSRSGALHALPAQPFMSVAGHGPGTHAIAIELEPPGAESTAVLLGDITMTHLLFDRPGPRVHVAAVADVVLLPIDVHGGRPSDPWSTNDAVSLFVDERAAVAADRATCSSVALPWPTRCSAPRWARSSWGSNT